MVELKNDEVTLKKIEGGSIISHPPLFSEDGRFLYVGCGTGINCYSVNTGKLVANYAAQKNFGRIVNICFHPSNSKQLVVSQYNGFISFWDLVGSQSAKNIKNEELCIEDCYITNGLCLAKCYNLYKNDIIFISYKSLTNDDSDVKIGIFSLDNGTLLHSFNETFTDLPHIWSLGGLETIPFLAAANNDTIQIYNLLTLKKNKIKLGSERLVTVVQCHPILNTLAIGDNTGRVVLYYNVTHKKTRTQTVYHWHTLPVNDIIFTSTGNQFYSGGSENVLVKWFCENIEARHFLPRLPANIIHLAVSTDNQYAAISTKDNGIIIINSQNKIHSTVQKFTWGVHASTVKEFENVFPAGVAFDRRSRSLVTNGWPGYIQFYSLDQSQLRFNMDVVCQNYVTQTRDQGVYNANVCSLAISDDSVWIATVERRPSDNKYITDDVLKFWSFDEKLQIYSLNTYTSSVDRISKICFRPFLNCNDLHMAATIHENCYKLWTPYSFLKNDKNNKMKSWHHEYTSIEYHNQPLNAISFSEDGCILAASFGPSIIIKVVEDPSDYKTSLTHGSEHIRFLEFGKNTSSWMLVAASNNRLLVWNVISETLLKTIWIQVSQLIADPLSEYMAIFTPDNDLIVFTPNSNEVAYKTKNIFGDNNKHTSILWALFAPKSKHKDGSANSWLDKSTLYFLTNQQELLKFEKTDNLQNLIEAYVDDNFTNLTPLGRYICNKTLSNDNASKLPQFDSSIEEDKNAFEILDEPAHLMLPLETQLERMLLACLKNY
ncbi:WD repeat-containing protein 75 [Adelges cooleyi]|uniref:WD repeat-containing protein 75 n=1 Tax=Adelges cooleyi TaxID=133065 RepID=UPI00217FB232|nr:WD repeat-containing protein 75 [Adelges cooleyi]